MPELYICERGTHADPVFNLYKPEKNSSCIRNNLNFLYESNFSYFAFNYLQMPLKLVALPLVRTLRTKTKCIQARKSWYYSTEKSIDCFRIHISHKYTLCLLPKFCINFCFQFLLGNVQKLKTIVYAKIWGQTKCIVIMADVEVVNFGFWSTTFDFETKLNNDN